MRIAVIDVGSNSVRLMTWADGKVLYKRVATTRLAEGLSSGVLREKAMLRSADAIATFVERVKSEGADCIYAFATAAVRSAKNGGEFCALVREKCGVELDVVSGEREAYLGLSGALGGAPSGAIVDIGGASTEVCVRADGEVSFSVSLNLGAVRLFDGCGQDFEKLSARILEELPRLEGCKVQGRAYAVGGTATTLASIKLGLREYDAARVQDLPLTRAEVEALAEKLLSLTQEERLSLAGMDEKRADIIGGGALFLFYIMKKLDLKEIFVSDRDNQEGYLLWRCGL